MRDHPTLSVDVRLLDMSEFKRLAETLASDRPDTALRLEFFGWANQITGYRLYYMLQYAKRVAGVKHLSLATDGLFWIEEASDWLIESGVDEIVIITAAPITGLADRVEEFTRRPSAPPVRAHSHRGDCHSSPPSARPAAGRPL